MINKLKSLISFFKLGGLNKQDNYLVRKEKLKYLYNKIINIFLKKNSPLMGGTLKRDIIIRNSFGLFYCRRETIDLHIVSDLYELPVVDLFKKIIGDSKVVVDVGANIGKYSILASKLNKDVKVIAIEPEKDNYMCLNRNKELNEIKNLKILKLGMHNRKGKEKLHLHKTNQGGHSIAWDYGGEFEEIDVNTFDNIFKDMFAYIDIVKIDTEGNEFEILEGAKYFLSNKKIKNIILEINEKRVINLLEGYGYSIKKIYGNNYLAYSLTTSEAKKHEFKN